MDCALAAVKQSDSNPGDEAYMSFMSVIVAAVKARTYERQDMRLL